MSEDGAAQGGQSPRPRAAGIMGMYAEMEGTVGDGYVVNELLACGGMAEVHLGLCVETGRPVVLKSVRPELRTPELEARLEREAELLQRLTGREFPRFIAYGLIAGRMRLVMELVEGESLRAMMERERVPGTREARRERVALVQRLAEAMGLAHAEGVVHRDLKPDNVMLCAEGGGPVVLDWGIAAQVDGEGGKMSLLTRTNVAAGTPYYMAPEQAKGCCLRPAKADVYALGVLLFELLSGERPVPALPGETEVGFLLRLQSASPRALREAAPWADAALEVICEKALTHDPEQRPTAAALAGQLGRWLKDEPVEWRRVSARERLWLSVRRRPKTWAAGVSAFLLLAVVAVVLAVLRNDAVLATREAEGARAAELKTAAASDVIMAQVSLERSGPEAAMPWLARALRRDPGNESAVWMTGDLLAGRRSMERVASVVLPDVPDPEGHLKVEPCGDGVFTMTHRDKQLHRARVGPDGRLSLGLWPDEKLAAGVVDFNVSRDGQFLAVVLLDGTVRVCALEDGRVLWSVPGMPETEGRRQEVKFSPSGRLLTHSAVQFTGQKMVTDIRVLRVPTGEAVGGVVKVPHRLPVQCLTITGDDRWLVMGAVHEVWLGRMEIGASTVQEMTELWRVKKWQPGAVYAACPVPGSARVLLSGQAWGYRVLCVDAAEGKVVWDVPVLGRVRNYTLGVSPVVVAPDGERFAAVGSEGDVMLHFLKDGSSAGPLLNMGQRCYDVFFTGEDRLVMSGITSAVCNWKTGERVAALPKDNLVPCGVEYVARRSSGDGTLEVYRIVEPRVQSVEVPLGEGKAFFDLDAGKRLLLAGAAGGKVQVLDLSDGKPVGPEARLAVDAGKGARRVVERPRLSGNGEVFFTWESGKSLEVYAVRKGGGRRLRTVEREENIRCAAISPDGSTLVLALEKGMLEVWPVWGDGKPRVIPDLCHPPPGDGAYDEPGQAMCMEFSADGTRLAVGTQNWCTVSIWNTLTWEAIQPPLMMAHSVTDVTFSPGGDGALWSTDFHGMCIRYTDPPYVKSKRTPPHLRLNIPVMDGAVSDDGRWFAAASKSSRALVYETGSMSFSPPVLEHVGDVTSVDWSPDGQRLLTATEAREVNVWDRVTGQRVYSWPQDAAVVQAAFGLGGNRIIIARLDGTVRVREVYGRGRQVEEGTPDLLEQLSGFRVGGDGQLVPVVGD